MIVADASPLVFLAQLGRLPLLRDLFETVLVPADVWNEASRPEDHAESQALEDARKARWVKIAPRVEIPSTPALSRRLHRGEIQVLHVARTRGVRTVLIDDALARRTARSLGLVPLGTLGALRLAVDRRLLTTAEARDSIEALPHLGFWGDPELMLRVIRRLESRAGSGNP